MGGSETLAPSQPLNLNRRQPGLPDHSLTTAAADSHALSTDTTLPDQKGAPHGSTFSSSREEKQRKDFRGVENPTDGLARRVTGKKGGERQARDEPAKGPTTDTVASRSPAGERKLSPGREEPLDGHQQGDSRRDIVPGAGKPTRSALKRKRPAKDGQGQDQSGQKTSRKRTKKVRFMTDEAALQPTEQDGNNRPQTMDAEKKDALSAGGVAAGPAPAVGRATGEQPAPGSMTEPKPGQQEVGSLASSGTSQGARDASSAERSTQTQDTSGSLGSMMAPVEYKNGARDPFSVIGTEGVEMQKPHLSQHLISLYGLTPLAASVARFDPVTGEKINRLRKSYEGQVAKLGLSGRNKAVKHEFDPEHKRLGLEELMRYPLEEWRIQHEARVPLSKGWNNSGSWEVSAEFKSKLSHAFRFESLPVPKSTNQEWEYILGHEKPRAKTSKPTTGGGTPANGPSKTNGISRVNTPAAGGIIRSKTPLNAHDAARPRRAGKKRRYNDDSFEGYGEGFVDDDAATDGGDSSNEGSKSERKKRRKDSTAGAMPPRPQGRMGSYGPGMIHQTGIGAYR